MFGSSMLEVALGVIFVFILVSIICTAIREGIESWLKTRAAYLEHGIRQLLADNSGSGLAKEVYNHPLIFGLFNKAYKPGSATESPALFAKGKNLPSYIPSRNFALALMDIAARGPMNNNVNTNSNTPVVTLATLRKNVANLGSPTVQRLLLTAIDSAQGDLNRAQANIEDWYNSGMDRVSGWYKRSTQLIIFFLALISSIALNINTLTIMSYLSTNQTARELLVKRAEALADKGALPAATYQAATTELNSLGLPIGWPKDGRFDASALPSIFMGGIIGWLLTAFAGSLGAPFWFDMLNKVMVIRSTVKPHEKSQEEASEDRQLPVGPSPGGPPPAGGVPGGSAPGGNPPGFNPQPPVVQTIIATPIENAAAPSVNANDPVAPLDDDDEADFDGCDVETEVKTDDEELPITQGGVA
ncbi:MAG: hypothetical protein EOP46_02115 [Sphingobacteriaceae bacterium]|nr:MAG: hypothetical protein EOP46_02115 [Sphingobacteriaceae bacterium]